MPVQAAEVLFPMEFETPMFHMGPFDNAALSKNYALVRQAGSIAEPDWSALVGPASCHIVTAAGREAIGLALRALRLERDDEVLIVNTTGSPYVTSCVTGQIDPVCRHSRHRSSRTRAVFLIHEFGFPASLPAGLDLDGLPIIEDCAYAFGSQNETQTVGTIGDFVVYSFSKAFPLQYGGLLTSRRPLPGLESRLTPASRAHLLAQLTHYLRSADQAFARRRANYLAYEERFAAHGFAPRFTAGPRTLPHAFVVAVDDEAAAQILKERMNRAGIESSVYYGGGGYFLPNHQGLDSAAIEYIVENFTAIWRDIRS
ncbi:MAG TPA: DegT/DnrJ/EryC1/StrS family aminotransferase [Candidatus Sulfotelmatobacter sp.]|nr:DegT/DnrJ/EryC1/StrS family aminotransferase [Candidatus Sulfotelmatobacter sp.]